MARRRGLNGLEQLSRPIAVQLCALPGTLVVELERRVELVPLYAMDPARGAAWLAANGHRARIVFTSGKQGCTSWMLAGLPALLLISIHGVGHDQIDLADARRKGVMVINTPDVLTDDVADLAVGLVIALLRKIPPADSHVRVGAWQRQEFPLGRRVSGRRFGILGFGRIGRAIAARLTAFGPVGYTSRRPKDVALAWHGDVLALARASDVMIVACPATIETIGLVDSTVLDALGPGGYLINVARGAVIDERALAAALADGRLAGAALDVFAEEPIVPDRFRRLERTVLTPHIGSATHEARREMAELMLADLDAFLVGTQPSNVVV